MIYFRWKRRRLQRLARQLRISPPNRHARLGMLELRASPEKNPRNPAMNRRLRCIAPLLLIFLLTTTFAKRAPARDVHSTPASVLELQREYRADQASLRDASELPASEAYLDRQRQLDQRWLERLDQFDFAALDARQKADFLLLRSQIRAALDETARAKQRLGEIAPLVPFRTTIHELETARSALGGPGRPGRGEKSRGADDRRQARQRTSAQAGRQDDRGGGPPRCEQCAGIAGGA